MTTKITLSSGAILEYEGDVLIGQDGSVLLEGKNEPVQFNTSAIKSSSYDEFSPAMSEDDLILGLLSPSTGTFFKLRMIDAMLNITPVHFELLGIVCCSERFRNKAWRDNELVRFTGLSDGSIKSRTTVLLRSGLVSREKRGLFCLTHGVSDVYYEFFDEIKAERERRHKFVVGAFDPNVEKSV